MKDQFCELNPNNPRRQNKALWPDHGPCDGPPTREFQQYRSQDDITGEWVEVHEQGWRGRCNRHGAMVNLTICRSRPINRS